MLLPGAAAGADSLYREELIAQARASKLSQDPFWRVLVHYRRHGKGWRTDAARAGGFLRSPRGETDPEAELEGTIASFFEPPPPTPDAEPAICQFPARFKWLKEKLSIDPARLPEPECPDFEHFRRFVSAEAATLVFASSEIDAPASMYGHTMIRLDKAGGSPLLATLVSYAAIPTSNNPVVYTIAGLAGGFEGRFSASPYFVKVAEYSNAEERDLWEYHLKLDGEAIDWLVRHLWELDSTHFPYYFMKENCSWQLLAALEAVDPSGRLRLVERHPLLAIPADTLRTVIEQGMVASRTLRPSQASIMLGRRRLLTRQEARVAARLSDLSRTPDLAPLQALPPERQALLLDAAFDRLKYRYGFVPKDPEVVAKVSNREAVLTSRRASLSVPAVEPPLPPKLPPEDGHDTGRAGIGFATRAGDPVYELLSWRIALHDPLDLQEGYDPDTRLEMGSLTLRVAPWRAQSAPGDAVVIDRFDVARVESVSPMGPWMHRLSWRLSFDYQLLPDALCTTWRCTAGELAGGFGITTKPTIVFPQLWYAYLDADPAAGPALPRGYRVGLGMTAGTLWAPFSFWRVRAEATLRDDVLGDRSYSQGDDNAFKARSLPDFLAADPDILLSAESSLILGKNLELRARYSRIRTVREGGASLYWCF